VRECASKRTISDTNENQETGGICVGFSIPAQNKTMTTQSELPDAVQVMVYDVQLEHSCWRDFHHRCRTLDGLMSAIRREITRGRFVAFRFVTIHLTVHGIPPSGLGHAPSATTSPKNERAAAIAALESIEARYTDGHDTYEDWKFMGDTAHNFLADNT
jgi:hypothetical protein